MHRTHPHTTSYRPTTTGRTPPATARGTVATVIGLLAVFWAAVNPIAALTALAVLLAVATAGLTLLALGARATTGRRVRRVGPSVPTD